MIGYNNNWHNLTKLKMAVTNINAREIDIDVFKRCLTEICPRFNVQSLKTSQLNALYNFMEGRDVFVNMPTGSGKSLVFQMAPLVEMWFSCNVSSSLWKNDAIIIVIAPLVALMQDQINRLNSLGLKAVYVSSEQDEEVMKAIENGEFTYVFMSPESSVSINRWRSMFEKKPYQERLIGVAVDEVHCVTQWGLSNSSNNQKKTAFRLWYSRINELRSIAKDGTPFMALTATATKKTKQQIFEMLELDSPYEVVDNPNRQNIVFAVQKMDKNASIADQFKSILDEMKSKGKETRRTIIYCQTIKQCAILFSTFKVELGINLYLDCNKDPRKRLCEMMHSSSPESIKKHVLEQFSKVNGHLRILMATIAYGMGVDCKNVTRVIHFGPSKSVEAYMQESGRCGRDGEQSLAILLYNSITIRATDGDMKLYINTYACRRAQLLQHFQSVNASTCEGHLCCDVCAKSCNCINGYCDVELQLPVDLKENSPEKVRDVSDEQMKQLKNKLQYVMKKLVMKAVNGDDHKVTIISCPNTLLEFGILQVSQVLEHAHLIFEVSDVMKYVDIWQKKHAHMVLEAVASIFGDIHVQVELLTKENYETEDDESDNEVDNWADIVNDPSFLSLLDQSEWNVDSFSIGNSDTMESINNNSSCLQILENVIGNI